MVVRKVLPCATIRAVILAHRAPLPLGQVRPPALPILLPGTCFFKSAVFDGLYSCHGVLDSLTGKKWHTMVSLFCLRISCTTTRAPLGHSGMGRKWRQNSPEHWSLPSGSALRCARVWRPQLPV